MSSLKNFRAGPREIFASQCAFFTAGFGMSTWAPMIPYIKQDLAIPPDTLGILLLCIGLSAFLFMPLAGLFARLFGCRAVIITATAVMFCDLLAIPFLPALWCYFPALCLLGAALGIQDVSMNLNSVVIERIAGRPIMSKVHAFWSVGCFCGSGLFALLAKAGLPVPAVAAIHTALVLGLACYFYPHLLPFHGDGGSKPFALPRGVVLWLSLLTCIGFLADGSIMDWGGVLLNESKGVDLAFAGLGFAAYSAAMLAMRLIGDRLVQRLGESVILLGGTALGMVCFFLITEVSSFPLLMALFLLLGVSLSNTVPVLYSMTARQQDMPIDTAVTAVTCMGYSGIILGPSLLGFLAQHAGLLSVFYAVIALLAVQAAASFHILRRK